jgi:hypothetical protein
LAELLGKAFFGGSRLPVASHESPLPATALGKIAYLEPRPGASLAASRCSTTLDLIDPGFSHRALSQQARRLETVLRASAVADVPRIASKLSQQLVSDEQRIPRIVAELFRQLALTPYQPLAGKHAALLRRLSNKDCSGPTAVIDILCDLLRPMTRHLTAFDLKTFHNFGADYPDLLLLDELLKLLYELNEAFPAPFASSDTAAIRRRSAYLQAVLARKRYEGLPIPHAPTSPGDNQRVWPAELPRASEESIYDVSRRSKKLFDGDPLEVSRDGTQHSAAALQATIADLTDPAALRELGTALFLDRPLGAAKPPGEIDRTPLLSYVAYSPSVAIKRLTELRRLGWIDADQQRELTRRARALEVPGYALDAFHGRPRPGVATLADAPLVSPDFLFLRTTRSSLDEFVAGFDLSSLRAAAPQLADWLTTSRQVLLIRTSAWPPAAKDAAFLTAFDEEMQPRLGMNLIAEADCDVAYRESLGVEWPQWGLRAVWPVEAAIRVLRGPC